MFLTMSNLLMVILLHNSLIIILQIYFLGCGNTCPIYCLPGFKSCPIAYNEFGCLLEGYEGSSCFPIEEDCPEVIDSCPDGRQSCLLSPDLEIHGCILSEHPLTGCPIECPQFCEDGELKCNGIMGSDGCLMSQTCIPLIDDETGCENHCPSLGCYPGDIHCPGFVLWNNNCTSKGYCLPPVNDYDGSGYHAGCPNFCHDYNLQCDWPNETSCRSYDENGCVNGHYCSPSTDPTTGCHNHCPVVCWKNETYCGGHAETWNNNCSSEAFCLPQILDNGCPGVCHYLGLECDVNEMICDEYNENGCLIDKYCHPIFNKTTGCANSCPCTGDSTTCNLPDNTPDDSCPAQSYCVGNLGGCPGFCFAGCEQGDLTCYNSYVDSNGCHLHEPYCYPHYNSSTGCFQQCPPEAGKMHCLREYMQPATSECPSFWIQNSTDGNGCPNICPPEECSGTYGCPASPDENGCPTERVCYDPSNNMDGSCGCPDLTGCPANTTRCPVFKIISEDTYEACYPEFICLPPPSPFLAHCDLGTSCPKVCLLNETYCDLGTDEDGCPLGGICVPYTGNIF